MSAKNAAWYLSSSICESILSSESSKSADKNIFGRPLAFSTSSDISFSIGFASTGLRAGTILNSSEISSNIESIANAVRLHIPLVIFSSVESQFQVNQFSQTGAVVFSAVTSQEALDLLLVSYRIAELSLIPVVVCMEESISNTEENILFPEKETLINFAGSTDILISSPTPSQQMIFGKSRKRIPNWFNIDNPVSIGAGKQLNEAGLETAAQQEYFYNHLEAIINDSFQELNKKAHPPTPSQREGEWCMQVLPFGKDLGWASYLVISYGGISPAVVKAIDEYNSKNKIKTASARLVQINPFPAKAIKTILAGKKVITILEQATEGINHSNIFKEVSCLSEAKQLKVFSGNYGSIPTSNTLLEVIANMLPGGKGKSKFWIDIDFTHSNSNYPKHQVLMQAIDREYPDIQNKIITAENKFQIPSSKSQAPNITTKIRRYNDQGPAYTKLSRFYDDTASFFHTNPEELVADPFQAIPVMPPSTANFNYAASEKKLLPVFLSDKCTGCGDCFLHCPHSAINPLVMGVENLIKAGIAISSSNGVKITQLTPLVKNIAKNIHEVIKQNKGKIYSVSDFIPTAFENVAQQMKLEGDKLQAAKQDAESVTSALKKLPISVTDIFYNTPELIKKGSGELFSLTIDTNSCTGCSVCETVCNDDALKMTEQNSGIISVHQEKYSLWEQMPDTSGETILRLLDEKKYNSFSAILLSRYFNQALNGKSSTKDGDASKSIIHLVTAVAEATIQPKIKEAIKTIDELITGLSQNIHDQLGSALPSQDFEALSKVLSEIKEDRKPFEEVIEKLGTGDRLKLVDTKSLKRKVDLTEALKKLKWLTSDGSTGTGRARMGIALDASLDWSNSYPWNNFTSPVLIQLGGSTPELAKGIVQGHIRQVLDNIKILRRAELEINGKYEPGINDAQIASLTWNDLTEKEKNLVPPIILIGCRARLAGKNLNSLGNMLDCNFPLKAIVLDDAVPSIDNSAADIIGGVGALLPALALQNAHVIKSSLAVPQHLFAGLSEAFQSNKPALAWVFAPAPSKHLIPSESFPKLHSLSLSSRAFPIFNFNPHRDGKLLSSKIELEGNPQSESFWMQSDLVYKENGEDKTLSYSLTWADWAYTLKSWKENFILHNEAMGKPVLVSEFVSLSKSERTGKSPVIYRINQNAELIKYNVSEKVIAATESCIKAWQVLREISGELSDFPEKLHKKMETDISDKYEKKNSEAKKEFENKITNLEHEHLQKIRIKLKEKLVMLSRNKV
ncbi:MAG: 4Fe-4S binding protein [Bacteroidetes bacterium]|nr:4Fe-4S binding protein [Bacteroidota bacterium]